MRAFGRYLAPLAATGLAMVALLGGGGARAQDAVMPAAKIVVYPGDLIRDEMLEDIAATGPEFGGPFASSRAQILGKIARRTLLPGRPIPLQAVDNPKVIRNGAVVKMVYVDGGLTIETTGAALQDGSIGDLIKLRNVDSGVSVQGRVQPDGSILVSGG